jgi:hypothetical protein
MLTQERLKELLSYDPETGVFTNLTKRRGGGLIGDAVGYKRPEGYIQITFDYKRYFAHRLAWFYMYGYFSILQIDHINEIKDDNRIINLRLVTAKQNSQNISKPNIDNTSGFKGVSWSKPNKNWRATIKISGKSKFLGSYNTPEEASEVYLAAKRRYHPFWEEKAA